MRNPLKRKEKPTKLSKDEENKKIILEKQAEEKARAESQLRIVEDSAQWIKDESDRTGLSVEEVTDNLLQGNIALLEFSETDGKASLVFKSWTSPMPAVGEIQRLSRKVITDFRSLRENFAPVAAGIEWHRDFSSGGGFTVQINDPKDSHKKQMKGEIEAFNRNVYQDQLTVGLDNIDDIMMDTALTDGCAAAEIVYDKEVEFMDYVDGFETVIIENEGGKRVAVKVMKPKEPNWHTDFKGGITRLKIIDDAYNRLRPYRHPKSGEILFWTLDEKVSVEWSSKAIKNKNVIKFHPWEIFWLSWNQRGTNLKGMSMIQPVYSVAKFVQAIQKAVGVGFNRWANKKYFFVCGSEKRPWSKPAQKAFLKAMAKMIKFNYVGIPVPPGFKIENIGGEGTVFEGTNLLDYLTGQICAGMQYPREFLEMGKTQGSDKAWLAWTVRYGRNQQQVRRAIEHQLWQRQLWCLHGKKYRVGKKGVLIANQEQRDVYVPSLQWRAEGRWHREKKTELFKSLLDAANPIDPPLKMAVQKGIADVLGFGAIDWETVTELFEIRSETSLLEAKLEKLEAKAKLEITEELAKSGKLKATIEARAEAQLQMAKQQQEGGAPSKDELDRRAKARLEGGVSRTPKGEAKPMGGTREPKRVAETIPDHFIGRIPFIPKEEAEQIAKNIIKTEKEKQKKIIAETERLNAEIESLKVEAEQRKKLGFEESEDRSKTEELRQRKLRVEIAMKHTELLKEQGSLLPKEKADELAEAMLETQRKEQERIDVETAKAKTEFERQQKKVRLMDELQERMNKHKKKTIRKEESKPLPFSNVGVSSKRAKKKEKEQKPQEIKLDINVKSEPVKAEVDIKVQTPKEIEETKAKALAELELIKQKKVFLEVQKEMVEEDRLEKEREKIAKKKLRERKRKVLDKIEKKVEENEQE